MKKLTILLLTLLTLFSIEVTAEDVIFRLDYDSRKTQYIENVRHQEIIGSINYNGTESLQKINYLGVDPTKQNIGIVPGDNYISQGWGKGDLGTIINNINTRYDNYEVIGGVNGDFFGGSGIPIEAFIRDYSVISAGLGYERTVLGFKDNGEMVFTRPCFDGYELVAYNSEGQLKDRVQIDHINSAPTNNLEISVYFDDYKDSISGSKNKVILNASETHRDDDGATFYGNGMFLNQTENMIESVNAQNMIVEGSEFNSNDLLTLGDTAIVQKNLCGDWEDVRFAIGGWEVLVTDGEATDVFTEGAGPTYRHPRTAVGIKEDGTVFFITVDGRDYTNGYLGMTAYELSQLMLYYHAVDAFNLDGGGSTAMMLQNTEGGYDYMNTPSDGSPRPVTNGVFFVKGEHKELEYAIFPDNRTQLGIVNDIFITTDGILSFEEVEYATGYEIKIGDDFFQSSGSGYQLEVVPGEYEVQIKTLADGIEFKDSIYTDAITYNMYTEDMNNLIDFFLNYTKKETND